MPDAESRWYQAHRGLLYCMTLAAREPAGGTSRAGTRAALCFETVAGA